MSVKKTYIRMRSRSSSDAVQGSEPLEGGDRAVIQKDCYRIVVMGAAGVGKTCIINRFLYEEFVAEYKATIEELHRGEYSVNGATVTLDILDTTGSYEFPAMRKLSITTGDAFILVYSLDNKESFEEVKALRQQILDTKVAESVEEEIVPPPIVIVGNKLDLWENGSDDEGKERNDSKLTVESLVNIDWNHGYVEASAKDNININGIFKAMLTQCQVQLESSPEVVRKNRRQSLPQAAFRHRRRNSCKIS